MYWYCGRLTDATQLALPVDEPGLLFGATLFSTLRVCGGRPVAWQEHRARLQTSVAALGWQQPNWTQVEGGVSALAERYPVLRVTLFPDGCEWITGRSLPSALSVWQQEGVRALVVSGWERSLPGHKTGNYLACWQARRQARAYDAQEAILTDTAGAWLETSTGNLWGWRAGTWLTPPVEEGILPGIARSQLLAALKARERSVAQLPWTPELVTEFEMLAYCNCIVGVVPLSEVRWPTGQTRRFAVDRPALRALQRLQAGC